MVLLLSSPKEPSPLSHGPLTLISFRVKMKWGLGLSIWHKEALVMVANKAGCRNELGSAHSS